MLNFLDLRIDIIDIAVFVAEKYSESVLNSKNFFFDCSISNAERELNVIYLIDDISQCVFIYVMEKSDSLSLLQGSLRQQQRSLSHNIDIDTRRND